MSTGETNRILSRLRGARDTGRSLVVAGVGSGLTARGALQGGADALACYNTAVYRVRNLPSVLAFLPYDDANALTIGVAPEIIAAANGLPVLLGLGAHDPRWSVTDLVDRAAALGASGVTNEPFVGIYSAPFRAQLDAAGCGFQRELELISEGEARGLLSLGWAFDEEGIRAMVQAGAHIVGAMLGFSVSPADVDVAAAVRTLDSMAAAALEEDPEVLVLAHGGPIGTPAAFQAALRDSRIHGIVTGSSAEREPVAQGVADAVRLFRSAGQAPE